MCHKALKACLLLPAPHLEQALPKEPLREVPVSPQHACVVDADA
jgi:hypothetical protein